MITTRTLTNDLATMERQDLIKKSGYEYNRRRRSTRVTKSESGTFVDTRVAIRSRQVVAEYVLNRASIADVE